MSSRLRSIGWFVAALAVADAAALAVLHARDLGSADEARAPRMGSGAAVKPAPPAGRNDGWALCQTRYAGREVSPVSVAITYLDAGLDRGVTPEVVRGWFGDLDPTVVDVYRLEDAAGLRRVSLEVSRSRWRRWDEVTVGAGGEEACSLVRGELLAHGVNRPRDAGIALVPGARDGRHDFELIYARRPSLYAHIEWAGTLDTILEASAYLDLWRWLTGA